MISIPDFDEYRDPRGRAPVDPELFKEPHSLILATSGQSMLGNFGQFAPYHPTSGNVYEFEPHSRLIYQVTDGSFPTMGMDGWPGRLSVLPYWGDTFSHEGRAARVLLAGHNIGGTTAKRWCPVGDLYDRSAGVLQALQDLGIPPNFWLHMLGQADVDINTVGAASSAQNFADLTRWGWQGLRSLGLDCTITIGQGAHWTNVSNVQTDRYAMIRQGQVLAAQGLACIALGPDDDKWPDSHRVDGVHPADLMRYYQLQDWLPAFPVF